MKNDTYYFVNFKGSLGPETFLIDEKGMLAISESYEKKEQLKFLSYKPDNLQNSRVVIKKYETIAHIEFIKEEEHEFE